MSQEERVIFPDLNKDAVTEVVIQSQTPTPGADVIGDEQEGNLISSLTVRGQADVIQSETPPSEAYVVGDHILGSYPNHRFTIN